MKTKYKENIWEMVIEPILKRESLYYEVMTNDDDYHCVNNQLLEVLDALGEQDDVVYSEKVKQGEFVYINYYGDSIPLEKMVEFDLKNLDDDKYNDVVEGFHYYTLNEIHSLIKDVVSDVGLGDFIPHELLSDVAIYTRLKELNK